MSKPPTTKTTHRAKAATGGLGWADATPEEPGAGCLRCRRATRDIDALLAEMRGLKKRVLLLLCIGSLEALRESSGAMGLLQLGGRRRSGGCTSPSPRSASAGNTHSCLKPTPTSESPLCASSPPRNHQASARRSTTPRMRSAWESWSGGRGQAAGDTGWPRPACLEWLQAARTARQAVGARLKP
jgi:hypothetical protein